MGPEDATLPIHGAAPGAAPGTAVNRKTERILRREWLYAVVRESMTRAGVLSSGYKFKVLSLDSRGRQYLIMMDIAQQYVGNAERMSEIEGHIAKAAKVRHDIIVTAVYWRVNEHVVVGLSRPVATPSALAPLPAVKPMPEIDETPAPAVASPRYEPMRQDEVEAFKQALAAIPTPKTLSAPGEIIRSGRRNPTPMPQFADTEMVDEERQSPLGATQYGELN